MILQEATALGVAIIGLQQGDLMLLLALVGWRLMHVFKKPIASLHLSIRQCALCMDLSEVNRVDVCCLLVMSQS